MVQHLLGMALLGITLSSPVLASSNNDAIHWGPLRTYAQAPLQTISLTPTLRNAFALDVGDIELYSHATIASVWGENYVYQADYYHNTLTLGGYWQLSPSWAFELEYRWQFAANNHLDTLTNAFHDTFGFVPNGRDNVAKHRASFNAPQYNITAEDFDHETLTHSVNLYVNYQLYQNNQHAVSLGTSLAYHHVNSGPFKREAFEQALQLNYGFRYFRHHFYSSLGITFYDDDQAFIDIPYSNTGLNLNLGYLYDLSHQHKLLLQVHFYEGAADDFSDYSDLVAETTLGYRYQWQNQAVEFAIIENIFNMDNSTDVAFTLGYRIRF